MVARHESPLLDISLYQDLVWRLNWIESGQQIYTASLGLEILILAVLNGTTHF